jgi:hypothetical protein
MADAFIPKLDILPPPQRRLWDELRAIPPNFVVYGGTGLALQLGHRTSIDFDFFSDGAFDRAELFQVAPFLQTALVTQQDPHTLSVIVERGGPVHISFFALPNLARLAPPLVSADNGVRIASLLDLAGTKVAIVQQRAEAKDYLDIDAILQDGRVDLGTALAAARAIYGLKFNPQITLKALSYFGDGNLPSVPKDVQDRLAEAARRVDLDRLPDVRSRR